MKIDGFCYVTGINISFDYAFIFFDDRDPYSLNVLKVFGFVLLPVNNYALGCWAYFIGIGLCLHGEGDEKC